MVTGRRPPLTTRLTHPQLDMLPKKTHLWHVFPAAYSAAAFNPLSENRFAARRASPPRAMYYAGDTPEVAIWETILRDVVADIDGCATIYANQLDGRVLARVRTTAETRIVDLSMPRLRAHSADKGELSIWQELQRTGAYQETHRAAQALLTETPAIGALKWISKQAGSGAAFVFYEPPTGPSLFYTVKEHRLEGSRRWYWIDRALKQAGIRRIETAPRALKRLP
jgi:hypothetical protein